MLEDRQCARPKATVQPEKTQSTCVELFSEVNPTVTDPHPGATYMDLSSMKCTAGHFTRMSASIAGSSIWQENIREEEPVKRQSSGSRFCGCEPVDPRQQLQVARAVCTQNEAVQVTKLTGLSRTCRFCYYNLTEALNSAIQLSESLTRHMLAKPLQIQYMFKSLRTLIKAASCK